MEAALQMLLETIERLDIASAVYCAARGHAESASYRAARGVAIPIIGVGRGLLRSFGQPDIPAQEEPEVEVVDVAKKDDADGGDAGMNQGEYDSKGHDGKAARKENVLAATEGGDTTDEAKPALVMLADDNVDLNTGLAATMQEDLAAATSSVSTSTPVTASDSSPDGRPDQGSRQDTAPPVGQEMVLNYDPENNIKDGGDAEDDQAASTKNEGTDTSAPAEDAGGDTMATKMAAAVLEAKKDAAETGNATTKRTAAPATGAAGASTNAMLNAAADEEPVRNLWGSGMAKAKQAADVKALFSKRVKVVSAKFGTIDNAPSFGFRTVSTAEEADNYIQRWHRTEVSVQMLFVERTKHETSGALLEPQPKTETGAAAWDTANTEDVVKKCGEATPSLERGNVWGTLDNQQITALAYVSTGGDKAQQRGPLRVRPDADHLHKRARRAVKGECSANLLEVCVCARRAVRRGQG
ncbi:uncharacterized protein LOC119389115 [Rhipicephalus sanguineus]|uniref:uncharacterized protein LOC119389115 n=1 Tax=Rhipicephalus sanguineus TaxID=34632 RepID=UPI001895892A|nr:uncharacterized protein LOC119389115 [Rhipicephalus sanguineus]